MYKWCSENTCRWRVLMTFWVMPAQSGTKSQINLLNVFHLLGHITLDGNYMPARASLFFKMASVYGSTFPQSACTLVWCRVMPRVTEPSESVTDWTANVCVMMFLWLVFGSFGRGCSCQACGDGSFVWQWIHSNKVIFFHTWFLPLVILSPNLCCLHLKYSCLSNID